MWALRRPAGGPQRIGTAAYSDRHDLKGRRRDILQDWQEVANEEGIEAWFQLGSKAKAYLIVCQAVTKFDRENGHRIVKGALGPQFVDEHGRLKPPSRRTFERRCSQVNRMEQDWALKGPAYAKQRNRTWQTTARPDRPYAEVEVDHTRVGILPGVCGASLERFASTYASARLYADLLALRPVEVRAWFSDAGVKPLSAPGIRKLCLVRRDEVEARLGERWRLDDSNGLAGHFWREFRSHLESARSSNHLVGGVGERARVRSGEGKLVAEIEVRPPTSQVVLSVVSHSKLSPARHSKVLERFHTLRAAWPNAKVIVEDSVGLISFTEEFRVEEPPSSDAARKVARKIDAQLTAFRLILCAKSDGATRTLAA